MKEGRPMFDSAALAYSLSQAESGWRWSVYDLDGVTVADGADPSQDAALASIDRLLRSSNDNAN
jgi:hypothetical protein